MSILEGLSTKSLELYLKKTTLLDVIADLPEHILAGSLLAPCG